MSFKIGFEKIAMAKLKAVVNLAEAMGKKGLCDPHMLNNLKTLDMGLKGSLRDEAAAKWFTRLKAALQNKEVWQTRIKSS